MFQKKLVEKPSTRNRFDQTRLVDAQDFEELSDQVEDIKKGAKKDSEAERNYNPVNYDKPPEDTEPVKAEW